MGRKKKIQLPDPAGDLFRIGGTVPPPVLVAVGFAYYRQHAPALSDALTQGGADASTITAVLEDYRAACWGFSGPTAKPEQMEAALDALRASTAYEIDAAAFFPGVYLCYKFFLEYLTDYRAHVQADGLTVEARRDYFAAQMNARAFRELRAGALSWLRLAGILRASDFAGMETHEIGRVLEWIDADGAAYGFAQYVLIAREAFKATPEQLAQLAPPEPFDNMADALAFADYYADEFRGLWADVLDGMKHAADGEPSTPERGETSTGPDVVIQIPRKIAALGSRDLWGTFEKDGEQAKNLLPYSELIKYYFNKYPELLKNPDSENLPITPYIVQKSIEGVNLLRNIKQIKPVQGIYKIETNLTEFSEICGIRDAGGEQKKQLYLALKVLTEGYCVVCTPRGNIAQHVLDIHGLGLTGEISGVITLIVPESLFSNVLLPTQKRRGQKDTAPAGPLLLTRSQMDKYKETAKAAPGLHFRNMILSKSHIKEETAIIEVFGYDTARASAELSGDASQVAAVKEYQRGNKPRDRNRLRQMFDRAAQKELITYRRTRNTAGEWVYKWTRTAPPTADESAAAEQTDEQ